MIDPWRVPVTVTLLIGGVAIHTGPDDLDALTAIEQVDLDWSQPTPRSSEDAGSVTVTLRHPTPGIIAVDDVLDALILVGSTVIRLGRWWVESVTWSRLPSGAWRHKVTATNAPGRAAGLRLAAEPWPEGQTLAQRVAAINASSPVGSILDAAVPAVGEEVTLAGRDVDNATAQDVITATASSFGLVVVSSATGLAIATPASATRVQPPVDSTGTPAARITRASSARSLPARAVEDVPRSLSRQGVTTRVDVRFIMRDTSTGQQTEQTRRYVAAGDPRATSQLTIDTDILVTTSPDWPTDPQQAYLGPIGDRAFGIADAGRARPRLDAARVALSLLDTPTLAALLDVTQRTRTPWLLDDAPGDVDSAVAVAAGAVTITAGRLALQVTLAPLALSGVRAMRWSDWPTPATVPTEPIMGDPIPTRFSHLATRVAGVEQISAADLRLVDAPTSWRQAL